MQAQRRRFRRGITSFQSVSECEPVSVDQQQFDASEMVFSWVQRPFSPSPGQVALTFEVENDVVSGAGNTITVDWRVTLNGNTVDSFIGLDVSPGMSERVDVSFSAPAGTHDCCAIVERVN